MGPRRPHWRARATRMRTTLWCLEKRSYSTATNACPTYLGRLRIGTVVRDSVPISPMKAPSRANTSDDWRCGTICQGSPVVMPVCACSGASARTAVSSTGRRMREQYTRRSEKWPAGPLVSRSTADDLQSPMSHFVTLALAQFQPRKGDYAGNLARIGEFLGRAAALDPRPRLVCFPETALTGYFLEGGVREHAVTAGRLAADLHGAYGTNVPIDVSVGFYEVWP